MSNQYVPLWFECNYQLDLCKGITLAEKLKEWQKKDTPALKTARRNHQHNIYKDIADRILKQER